MAYYAPPQGDLTAAVAWGLQKQSLSGLGILPTVNVRTPRAIPVAMGAARRRFEEETQSAMTGMGIIRVKVPRLPVPAAVTFQAARSRAALSGLGAGRGGGAHIHAEGAMPVTAGVRRQSAPFTAPGGGYSQIPGFLPPVRVPLRGLRGLGQDPYTDALNLINASDNVVASPDGSIVQDMNTGYILNTQTAQILDANGNYIPQTAAGAYTVAAPTGTVPTSSAGAVNPYGLAPTSPSKTTINPVTGAISVIQQPRVAAAAPLTISPTYLLIGGGVLLLAMMGGKRRRNPRRRNRRG